MSIALRPETIELIQERIDSGRYEDADAVVGEALDLLRNKEAYDALKAAIQVGVEQMERGELIEMTDDFRERVLERAKERSRLGLAPSREVMP